MEGLSASRKRGAEKRGEKGKEGREKGEEVSVFVMVAGFDGGRPREGWMGVVSVVAAKGERESVWRVREEEEEK